MESQANSLEFKDDLGKSPQAIARRWKLELKLADKRESAWRKRVSDIYNLYTPETPANNSFNILWTNTETLRQSVYNSLPQPDARRRFNDEDPLGKAVGEVLTRALTFSIDTNDFDGVIKGDVLTMLLGGRGVSRECYVPDIKSIGGEDSAKDDDLNEDENYEEIEWEQSVTKRVQWDDFRILCAGKVWEEVNAIGFRHRFTREDCIEKFGDEIGKAIPLDSVADEDVKKTKDADDLFKTAEVWEIWDKDEKQVIWICPTYDQPCKVQDDPLGLQGFFPIPKPLYAIENDTTLVPAALYTQYEQQAKELNKVSVRINKLVDALKVRGIYDSTLGELAELMKGGDNDLIAAENVTALLDRGGLEKAIWLMPIDTAAMVLKELYVSRDAIKQVIYEITGISDIMRSASDPNETFGAQKIKTQWGTQRLQRMQKEVQRYIRDLIRLKAEIISEKFQPETLEAMTLVKLPHQAEVDQQKQQMMMQYQQAAQQAMQAGQPAPPQPQMPPDQITWEAVTGALQSDETRSYRIDIETDSTLSASQDADMQGMKDLLSGLSGLMQGFGPMVQEGAMSVDVLKELMLTITRRAKMGSAVEDVIDKIQQPQPKPDPNAGKAQADMQMHQMKLQADVQLQQAQQQHEAQLEQMKAQNNAQIEQLKAQSNQASEQARMTADAQVEQARAEASIAVEHAKQQAQYQVDEAKRNHELSLAQMGHDHNHTIGQHGLEFDKWKVEFEASTKILIAQISAKTTMDTVALSAQQSADAEVSKDLGNDNASLIDMHGKTLEAITGVMNQLAKPKTIVRDENGKVQGLI